MVDESPFEQKRKYWEQLRNAIVHEDNLVNHRLTWLLTIEAFLLGGFFLVQSSVLANKLTGGASSGIEVLLVLSFLGACWIAYISGSLNAAAYQQIAFIRNAWLQKYPEERRPIPRLPRWIRGSGALPEAARENPYQYEGETETPSEKLPEYPPIMGEFRYSYPQSAQRIPFVLLVLNGIAIVACLVIGLSAVSNGNLGQQPVKIELEKTGAGAKVKATFEMERPPQELANELKSLLQSPKAAPSKQP
jgi:hypothetical protein